MGSGAEFERIGTGRLAQAVAQGWCRWDDCPGSGVLHRVWGVGLIERVDPPQNGRQTVSIFFGGSTGRKRFRTQDLSNLPDFLEVLLSSSVYQQIVTGEQQAQPPGKQPVTQPVPPQPPAPSAWATPPAVKPISVTPIVISYDSIRTTLARYGVDRLYYMAHINNIPSILHRGILSHNAARPLLHQDISLAQVQEKRNRPVLGSGRTVHDYANVYFATHTPMQYIKTHSNHQGLAVMPQDDLVFVEVDAVRVFAASGVVFTDGNAAANNTEFHTRLHSLDQLRWDIIRTQKCYSPEYKHHKAAEVLVPDCIPPAWFLRVVVHSRPVVARLTTQIQDYNRRNSVTTPVPCACECDPSRYY